MVHDVQDTTGSKWTLAYLKRSTVLVIDWLVLTNGMAWRSWPRQAARECSHGTVSVQDVSNTGEMNSEESA